MNIKNQPALKLRAGFRLPIKSAEPRRNKSAQYYILLCRGRCPCRSVLTEGLQKNSGKDIESLPLFGVFRFLLGTSPARKKTKFTSISRSLFSVFYFNFSSHSFCRNPVRIILSEIISGRLTSIPSVASNLSCSSSLIVSSLSFSPMDL